MKVKGITMAPIKSKDTKRSAKKFVKIKTANANGGLNDSACLKTG